MKGPIGMETSIVTTGDRLYLYQNGNFYLLLPAMQYAEKHQIVPSTALRWAKSGQAKSVKIGRDYFFPENDPDDAFINRIDSEMLNDDLEAESQEIFKKLGLTREQAINLFLKQTVLKRGLPFPLILSNEENNK